jgi:hypothetical protein
LNEGNFSKEYLEAMVNHIKAQGVRAIITVEEKGEKEEGEEKRNEREDE